MSKVHVFITFMDGTVQDAVVDSEYFGLTPTSVGWMYQDEPSPIANADGTFNPGLKHTYMIPYNNVRQVTAHEVREDGANI